MSGVLRKPRALRPGDRLALVAPASGFDRAEFDAGVEELRALGFEPVWHGSVFERRAFVAGPAESRADAIDAAWQDPGIAGLVGVRGGYGSVHVLPLLDPSRFMLSPKAFVGYSDLTSLLTFLTCQCGLVAFHGPTVAGRLGKGVSAYDRDSFMRVLTVAEPAGEIATEPVEVLRSGEARGRLLGGTLAQLAAAAGTPFALTPWDDTILLLEDVGERPYRIDRLVQQLRLSGILTHVRGIVLGTFPGCDEPGGTVTVRDTLADLFADVAGPVVFGFPTGHVSGPARTLPLGVQARLVAAATARLVIEEAAVED
jgi:muramoyltetrapeptide carboxypeptidase